MSEGERVVRGGVPASSVVLGYVTSSVGAKVVMSLTGIGLWGFVIIHLLGNLQIYQGPDALNEYGVWLRSLGHGTFVWLARAGLAAIFVVHIASGLMLAQKNRAARGPVGYQKKRALRTNVAALTMASSGLLILVFLVFHLGHTTLGFVDPTSFSLEDSKGRHDIFKMMHIAFKQPLYVIVYLVGQTLLLSHLIHGTASLWQSIGFHHAVWSPVLRIAGRAIAALIVIGNVSMPLAVYFLWSAP